ncbi:MAG: amidohydrolase, partial [Gordonibacter sp.]
MHCTWTGNNLRNIDFRPVTERAEVKRIIKEYAAKTPDGEWIQGNSWNELVWDDQAALTLAELDELCPNNPLFCMRTCFHTAMVNSKALELAGITDETLNPEGGTIGRGEDAGYLFENSAMDLVQSVIPALTARQRIESIEAVGKYLNSLGITTAIDANLQFKEMRTYLEAKKEGKLSYRANLMFYLDSAYGDKECHLRRLEEANCITDFGDKMLKINGVKVTLDGIPATYTALMREGYKTRPDYCGSSVWTQEEITAFVCKAQELGWQFGIHTIGDAAEDMAINAIEAANKISPVWDRRHYLIHYQFPREDQWERMRKLNINVTVQPTLVSTMGEAPQFYEEQALRIQSPGLMFKNNIICGGGSDSPVVPPDPVMGMYYAITRLDETTGNILSNGDESKVSPIEALLMWTMNAAYFLHSDDYLGSIEVGKLADLTVFPSDFIAGDVEGYRTAKVEKTLLGGKIIYEA